MVAHPPTPRRYTSQEYLTVERSAPTRSEFLDGEIIAIADASVAHITINDNITIEIGMGLKRTTCQGMSQDMKVAAGTGRVFVYPDYLIVCGEQRFRDTQRDILTNPRAIFEILSPTTQDYDRTTKFDLYKLVPSLEEYILIAQDAPRIEHWVRQADGFWKQNVLIGIEAVLDLETASVSVPLSEIYDRIDFESRSE